MIMAQGLTKRYGRVQAVDDLSFVVESGVVTGFLGPNGAGKSTTMRLMLGLDRGAGRTEFDGRAYAELERPLRQVGVVLDARAVHPGRTARGHLRMIAAGAGIPLRQVDEVLDLVGLAEVAGRRVGGFSLGMCQRLGLAAALLGNPAALLLDEPFNGLDPQGVRWLRDLLKMLAAEGRTVLVSSHLLNEMAQLADALIVIGGGRLIAAEPLADFAARHCRAQVVARADRPDLLLTGLQRAGYRAMPQSDGTVLVDDVDTDTVATVALHAGIVLRELAVRQVSLEEAFFAATADATQYHAQPMPSADHHPGPRLYSGPRR